MAGLLSEQFLPMSRLPDGDEGTLERNLGELSRLLETGGVPEPDSTPGALSCSRKVITEPIRNDRCQSPREVQREVLH
jgi:hypothetical protein